MLIRIVKMSSLRNTTRFNYFFLVHDKKYN